jgi:hypothetical protein
VLQTRPSEDSCISIELWPIKCASPTFPGASQSPLLSPPPSLAVEILAARFHFWLSLMSKASPICRADRIDIRLHKASLLLRMCSGCSIVNEEVVRVAARLRSWASTRVYELLCHGITTDCDVSDSVWFSGLSIMKPKSSMVSTIPGVGGYILLA